MSNNNNNSNESETPTLRLITLGESSVGKTSMILRYTDNKFSDDHIVTIGVQFKNKYIQIESHRIKVQIWDTAGQEKFRSITKAYYSKANGALFVFDISSKDTFLKIQDWIDSITQSGNDYMAMVLVGNKCDMERSVTKEEAQQFADQNNIAYFETSAKDGTNIDEAFEYLAGIAFRMKPIEENNEPKPREDGQKCSC